MVHFRKSLLLLAVMALVAGIASAQVTNPLSCNANSGVPPTVRSEGLAEEVGQIVITCTGGTSVAAGVVIPTVNVTVFLSTPITSRLMNSAGLTEALLLIDEPAPAAQILATASPNFTPVTASGNGVYNDGVRPNAFLATRSADNAVSWLGVPFDPPGTTPQRVIRLANIRANVQNAGSAIVGLPFVQAFISISGTGSLPITSPNLTVAYVQKGLAFSIKGGTFNQCDNTAHVSTLTYTELLGTAFRVKDTAGGQAQPGTIYNTESMFWNPAFATVNGTAVSEAGHATQATRLSAAFTNIPANVKLQVSTTATNIITPVPPSTYPGEGDTAILIPGSTSDSSGNLIISNGSALAVWEITTSNPSLLGTLKFSVTVTYPTGVLPDLGTISVTGSFSPVSTVGTMSLTEPAPRFVAGTPNAAITIQSCRTNLLFPFVTNQAGFDTGIAISNTSMDPFSTPTQKGACTLNYYSKDAAFAGLTTDTSGVVDPGRQLLTVISSGGNLGLKANPGFQGYVIATCNFQYAHGFAFVSSASSSVAEGYLALVMDQAIGSRTGATSETLMH